MRGTRAIPINGQSDHGGKARVNSRPDNRDRRYNTSSGESVLLNKGNRYIRFLRLPGYI